MDNIAEYTILTATSPQDLIKYVNEHIKQGWEPTGGVQFVISPQETNLGGGYIGVQTVCIQAMIK
jgi:hypothetical protein